MLIKSISGIRGTIGGTPGEALTPLDTVKYAAAFGSWVIKSTKNKKVIIGRDARISGEMVSSLVRATLQGLGIDVIDLGLSTTPTVEMAVTHYKAGGGIIITASHNPINWNALKLLNHKGEFVSEENGLKILELAESGDISFAEVKKLGSYTKDDSFLDIHIQEILKLDLVDIEAIKSKKFRVAIDCVNSTGGIAVPKLLTALGVTTVEKFFCEPNGDFPHNPEPLPENITHICKEIEKGGFDLGIVVDPDVDRLVFICEDGSPFGEEYTLVSVADYVLSQLKGGNTTSNLSSTRALRDITEKNGGQYHTAEVGEVKVVSKMKEVNAVIGGEGNGGIIYPELHYGRDALVGIALFLTHLAKFGKNISQLRAKYPTYHMSKNKIELTPEMDIDKLLDETKEKYKNQPIIDIDGVKIEFDSSWVHLRKSNTEPIIRIYSEAETLSTAEHLASKIKSDIKEFIAG